MVKRLKKKVTIRYAECVENNCLRQIKGDGLADLQKMMMLLLKFTADVKVKNSTGTKGKRIKIPRCKTLAKRKKEN